MDNLCCLHDFGNVNLTVIVDAKAFLTLEEHSYDPTTTHTAGFFCSIGEDSRARSPSKVTH
jgi:hypothetical protein